MNRQTILGVCVGFVMALLIAQTTQPKPTELLPLQVGRFQVTAALGYNQRDKRPMPAYYFLDTATGRLSYQMHDFGSFEPDYIGIVGTRNDEPFTWADLNWRAKIAPPRNNQPAQDQLY